MRWRISGHPDVSPIGLLFWSRQRDVVSKRNVIRKDDRVTRDRTTDVRNRRVETRVDLSASELWVESDLFEQSRLGRQIPQSSGRAIGMRMSDCEEEV